MKCKIKAVVAAAAALALFACGCTAADTTEYKTDITVVRVETAAVEYSYDFKENAAQSLLNALTAAVTSVYGEQSAKNLAGLYGYVLQAVDCCESLNVSESDMLSLVDALCQNADLLVRLSSEKSDGDISSALQLFASVAKIIGADAACRLFYDCSLIYCGYEYDKYMGLYEKYGYPYQLTYAEDWLQKSQSVVSVGAENFKYLLKTAVSAAAINGGQTASLLESSGEIALYLRAQGYMTAKLTLEASDWNFVFNALGDNGYSAKMKAICAAGAAESLSQNFSALVQNLSYALTKADAECVQAAMDGGASAFLKRLLSVWTDDMWQSLVDVISVPQDGEAYTAYFAKAGVYDEYVQFSGSVTRVSLQQLKDAEGQDFYGAFENFIAAYSPELAFVLFEL